jgi:hypothetical protein
MKRLLSVLAALGLVVTLTPGSLQAQPKGKVVIEDPEGDANFINDQGTGDGSFGDFVLPVSPGTVSDLVEITFANDARNFYITLTTVAAPPALTAIGYRVRVNPDGPGGSYCLNFEAMWPGGNNVLTEPVGHLRDACEGGDPIPLEIRGTTLVLPRAEHEALGRGQTLVAPQAQSFLYSGDYPNGVIGPYPDTTLVGEDYDMVDRRRRRRR